MKWLLVLAVLVVLVVAVVVAAIVMKKRKDTSSDNDQPWPFCERRVMSKQEQVLYFRLVEALPECIVLAQVQLSRVLDVKKGHNFRQWLNRIDKKSLDYLVCLKKSCSVVAAIELDDSTHEREDRKKTDQNKNRALQSAGVKLIRWQAKNLPDVQTIRQTFTS